jgi:hypothetical protein
MAEIRRGQGKRARCRGLRAGEGVDGRDKPGHDGRESREAGWRNAYAFRFRAVFAFATCFRQANCGL